MSFVVSFVENLQPNKMKIFRREFRRFQILEELFASFDWFQLFSFEFFSSNNEMFLWNASSPKHKKPTEKFRSETDFLSKNLLQQWNDENEFRSRRSSLVLTKKNKSKRKNEDFCSTDRADRKFFRRRWIDVTNPEEKNRNSIRKSHRFHQFHSSPVSLGLLNDIERSIALQNSLLINNRKKNASRILINVCFFALNLNDDQPTRKTFLRDRTVLQNKVQFVFLLTDCLEFHRFQLTTEKISFA